MSNPRIYSYIANGKDLASTIKCNLPENPVLYGIWSFCVHSIALEFDNLPEVHLQITSNWLKQEMEYVPRDSPMSTEVEIKPAPLGIFKGSKNSIAYLHPLWFEADNPSRAVKFEISSVHGGGVLAAKGNIAVHFSIQRKR